MELNMRNQNARTIAYLTNYLNENIQANYNDPDDADVEFQGYADKVVNTVYRLWEPRRGDPTYRHLEYLHGRLIEAGYENAPTAVEAYEYYRQNFSPEEDDFEDITRMDRLRNWLRMGQQGAQEDDNEKRSIRNSLSRDMNFFERRNSDRRVENWFNKKFRVGQIKRLFFSEVMKEVQTGVLSYLQLAGIKYARWQLSPMHSVNDICDVHARHIWLDFEDVGPANREIRKDLRGVFRADTVESNIIFPELQQWGEDEIEGAIRAYGTHRESDYRPKRAGYLIPHPSCKCFINPIIPEIRE
jgi:hypothetical protein